jgi:hypothetical protein
MKQISEYHWYTTLNAPQIANHVLTGFLPKGIFIENTICFDHYENNHLLKSVVFACASDMLFRY